LRRIEDDFMLFISGQDLNLSLKALLKIIVADKIKDKFIYNTFNRAYYIN